MSRKITVKCIGCDNKRDIQPYGIAPGYFLMCGKCYLPMMPVKATAGGKKP